MAAPRLALFGCAAALSLSGCVSVAGLQDWHYERAAKSRAQDAWVACYDRAERKALGDDFEDGYREGFVAAATGVDCRVPPVAPPQYWSAKYQCCEGQAQVQNWFRGYEAGLLAAESRGLPAFNTVPVSPHAPVINRTGCGTCYAADPCQPGGCPADGCQPSEGLPGASQPSLPFDGATPLELGPDVVPSELPPPLESVRTFAPKHAMIGPVDRGAMMISYRSDNAQPPAASSEQP